ncbi:protein phosphatase 2C domain-containing protein [Microbacterium sp. ARD32]|uniref:PP2C family protein-serine/threonine phosphatase n=1 Tax=Microbacterium sp. ARD32 TaxID=2962577 RepID=UPI0028810E0D|nr:protein phosphatase 2C domain-containing protein [Microbacterium sp. ARD32]MDT0158202.1 protein phosphatase 2C domain-containing protein [Microbacterium sp. ARD32]
MSRDWHIEAEIAAATHIGVVRGENQDVVLVDGCASAGPIANWSRSSVDLSTPLAVAVVDGMGGHRGGSMAAWLVARVLADGLPRIADGAAARALAGTAHATVRRAGEGLGTPEMGAAAAAMVLSADGFTAMNVGDCRVHRVVDGYLGQLSVDDAVPDHRVPGRTMLTSALGGGEQPPVDAHWYAESWAPGFHRFLLVSDGVLPAGEALAARAGEDRMPTQVAAGVIDDALSAGPPDNVSVIVIDVQVRRVGEPE